MIHPIRATVCVVFLIWLALTGTSPAHAQQSPNRTNILWITCEDISPNLGCFGDVYAVTPHLDRLATEGVRYTNAFAVIGVCAPARSTLITGMYAPSLGIQHMRCQGTLPDYVRCFSEYLRTAGYYCTNNVKTDYNFVPPESAWDESSRQAHWRNRPAGTPFFSVFNFTSTHESQIRLPEEQYAARTADFTPRERHDPNLAPIPPYHPDTAEVRRDWARYADLITYMDRQVGDLLQELDEDGLADDTIVFFFSDHGAGMPRSKRWLYDTSLRVPMIVRFPEKYRDLAPALPGGITHRLVSFVDFAPTVLSLAGVDIPKHMQGEPFLGEQATEQRRYLFGFRDRMDERYDLIRSVRDDRYKYIRNYMPHLTRAQYLSYMYEMPTMQVWQRLADAGLLLGPERRFFEPTKAVEEFYDTWADPYEVNNLAERKEYQPLVASMRKAHREWMTDIVDLGLLPEEELRTRFGDKAPYQAVRDDPKLYPQSRLFAAADLANRMDPETIEELAILLRYDDAAVRWWAAVGLFALGADARPATKVLTAAMSDTCGSVRVAAAETLCNLGHEDTALPVLVEALRDRNEWVRLAAANSLDRLDEKARPALDALQQATRDENGYVVRVVTHAIEELGR